MFYRIDYEQLNALAGVVCEQAGRRDVEEPEPNSAEGMSMLGMRSLYPASSGNISPGISELFPELLAEVAQAVKLSDREPLPRSLRRAIAQFPERVRDAIAYLKHQQ